MRLEHLDRKLGQQYFGAECKGGTSEVHLFCLHETMGPTAAGGANTLHTRPDGSAQICLGDPESEGGYRIGHDNETMCGVAGFNEGVFHCEMANTAVSRKVWFLPKNVRIVIWSAWWAAHIAKKHNLPMRFLRTKQLNEASSQAACKGFTFHRFMSKSNKSTSTHSDPVGLPVKFWWLRVLYFHDTGKNYYDSSEFKKWKKRNRKEHK